VKKSLIFENVYKKSYAFMRLATLYLTVQIRQKLPETSKNSQKVPEQSRSFQMLPEQLKGILNASQID